MTQTPHRTTPMHGKRKENTPLANSKTICTIKVAWLTGKGSLGRWPFGHIDIRLVN